MTRCKEALSGSFLVVLVTNFRRLLSEQEEFLCSIDICNPHVILGSESWLSSEMQNHELLLDKDYLVYRRDRLHSRGGGVLIVKKCFHSVLVKLKTDTEMV